MAIGRDPLRTVDANMGPPANRPLVDPRRPHSMAAPRLGAGRKYIALMRAIGTYRLTAIMHAPADTRADHPLVSPYGYIINSAHKVLICPPCGVIVNPLMAREHIVRNHKVYGKPPKDFNTSVATIRPALTYMPAQPTTSVPVIFGLKPPPTEPSVICPDCKRGYAEISYTRPANHPCLGARQTQAMARRSLVQRFSMDSRHSWFPVHTPPPSPLTRNVPDVFQLYRQQQVTTVRPGEGPTIPENYRNLEQFVARENWPTLFGSDPLETLLELIGPPQPGEGFGQLTRQVHVYLDQFQAILKAGMPFSVRRDLGTRPSPERQTSYIVHHKDVQHDSLVRYARSVARLLAFLMRAQQSMDDGQELPQAVHLEPDQLAAARRLRHLLTTDTDLLRQSNIPYHGDDVAEADADGIEDEEEDDHGHEGNDDVGEDDDIDDPTMPARGHQWSSTVVRPHAIPIIPTDNMPRSAMSRHRCPSVTQGIFALLYTLFTQIPQGQQSHWHNPLSLFVPYSSRRKDGTYIAPGQLTHVIAALTFTARICMFTIMHVQVSNNPQLRYSA
jgi:hypothetical protein